jgi:hypothetical protein
MEYGPKHRADAYRPAEGEAWSVDSAKGCEVADPTLQYVVDSRSSHERLRQILAQVAGFSLLVMTNGGRVLMLDVPLAMAGDALTTAGDRLRALQVPRQARHHYHHTIAAAHAVDQAIGLLAQCMRARSDDAARAALTRCLRSATDHLRAASRLLPGFEMVDLRQACCAYHAEIGRAIHS